MADIPSILKQVLDSSTQLSGWALIIGGGAVAVIVSTSYYRPKRLCFRFPYLLFLPGWACIGYSLYLGNSIVGKYLASIMVREDQIASIAAQVNDIFSNQHVYLLYSLGFFGLWLFLYVLFWVFFESFDAGEK